MVRQVHVRNYRCLSDVDVSIVRPTVLVGRNGAGKSAFVDVLRLIRDAVRDGLDKALTERQGMEAVRRWGRTKPFHVDIELSLERGVTYGLSLASAAGEAKVKSEYLRGDDLGFSIRDGTLDRKSGGVPVGRDEPGTADLYIRRAGGSVRVHLMDMAFYGIYPNTLRKPQPPGDARRLLDDGSNLAAVLQKLSPSAHDRVRMALRRVVPDVHDFSVARVGGWLTVLLHHADPGGGAAIERDVAQESDGTLRALALVTALFGGSRAGRPRLIAMEEPEIGIHPGAVAELWSLIEEASGSTTILLTTHSPDLIARVPADRLRIVQMVDGVTSIGGLAQHQLEAVQRELFTTGDLLRIQGLEAEPSGRAHG